MGSRSRSTKDLGAQSLKISVQDLMRPHDEIFRDSPRISYKIACSDLIVRSLCLAVLGSLALNSFIHIFKIKSIILILKKGS